MCLWDHWVPNIKPPQVLPIWSLLLSPQSKAKCVLYHAFPCLHDTVPMLHFKDEENPNQPTLMEKFVFYKLLCTQRAAMFLMLPILDMTLLYPSPSLLLQPGISSLGLSGSTASTMYPPAVRRPWHHREPAHSVVNHLPQMGPAFYSTSKSALNCLV